MIVGDVHGFHNNLRKFLVDNKVINKKGEAINRDEFKVYCTGDLIDGNINRQGDILNLEYTPEWFDAVCIGNHEYAFLGGRDLTTRRKHDRQTTKLILDLVDKKKLVPSVIAGNYLLTHAGLSEIFDFKTIEDAHEFINVMWNIAPDFNDPIAVFDWKNNHAYSMYNDSPTSGIFNLSWHKERNDNFGQVMGHSIIADGPTLKHYENGIDHWNVDIGGKNGNRIGGIIIDDETSGVVPVLWGERKTTYINTQQKSLPIVTCSKYDVTVTPSVRAGEEYMSAWGEKFKVTSVNLTQGLVILSSVEGSSEVQKYLNDNWDNWQKIEKSSILWNRIPLTGLDDIFTSILEDNDILLHYRREVVNLERN